MVKKECEHLWWSRKEDVKEDIGRILADNPLLKEPKALRAGVRMVWSGVCQCITTYHLQALQWFCNKRSNYKYTLEARGKYRFLVCVDVLASHSFVVCAHQSLFVVCTRHSLCIVCACHSLYIVCAHHSLFRCSCILPQQNPHFWLTWRVAQGDGIFH